MTEEESFSGLKTPVGSAADKDLMAAAIKLYEMGKLSSGAAARLAGVPRVAFLSRLADNGVDTFRVTEDQLLKQECLV